MDDRLDYLAGLAALDGLDDEERREFRAWLADSETARDAATGYSETGALIAASLEPVAPPADARRAILNQIQQPAGTRAIRANEGKWRPHAVPGIEYKELSHDRDRVMLLMRFAPGARLPAHRHHGAEECYVVEGSLWSGDLHLKRGDFLHADAGSSHDALWSEEGGMALLVVSREDDLAHA